MTLRVILEPSEDGGFTVVVPALPGCISEAIELYLDPVDDDTVFSANRAEVVELAL